MTIPTLNCRHLPNLITGVRLILVAPIVWLLLDGRYPESFSLFVIAGVSDLADGFLARRFGWTSRLGSILDPLADKALVVGSLLVLGWRGEVPMWLVILGVGRDVMLIGLSIGYHCLIEPLWPEPLPSSKINTLLQLMLVAAVLFGQTVQPLPETLLTVLVFGTGLTTLWSGCAYLCVWGARAWGIRKGSARK